MQRFGKLLEYILSLPLLKQKHLLSERFSFEHQLNCSIKVLKEWISFRVYLINVTYSIQAMMKKRLHYAMPRVPIARYKREEQLHQNGEDIEMGNNGEEENTNDQVVPI